jgi:phosphatidylserine decarboxylase
MKRLFILFQYLAPQHGLSRLVALFANSHSSFIKTPFIRFFIKRYKVDMSEAEISDIGQFKNFNEFFTRQLKSDARKIDLGPGLVISPADGAVSELGQIQTDSLLQAKGQTFSATELLGGKSEDAEPFQDGSFITIYLSPRDYHRVHMPLAGKLLKTIYVPGKLFSVNQTTANAVPNLFARNERLVCFFDTELGPMALVLVGAMIVAGIDTVWSGQACPNKHGLLETDYLQHSPPIELGKGSEMGRFRLGSTVILLFGPGAVAFNEELENGFSVRMGEQLATISKAVE